MGRIKNLILALVLTLSPVAMSGYVASTVSASNDAGAEACAGLESLGVDCNAKGSAQDVAAKPISSLINTLSIIIGAVAVVMIIYGGLRFVTSSGDADGTKAARNTIVYACIGLLIVLLAQTIVYFVFNKANDLQKAPAPAPVTSVPIIDNWATATVS